MSMLKTCGEAKNYSEILMRVTCFTFLSALICTIILINASPNMQKLISSIPLIASIKISILSIENIIISFPSFFIALIFRVIKFHNIISKLLYLRHYFDTRYLLFPIAQNLNIKLTKSFKKRIIDNRIKLMNNVFYPYASFYDPINKHGVTKSADTWGWFWVLIESEFLFIATAIILLFMQTSYVLLICLIICLSIIIFEYIFLKIFWSNCQRNGKSQVNEILSDKTRKKNINKYFNKLK